jgi:hypothetical protein
MNDMLTQKSLQYSMICKTSDLKETMKFLKRAVPKSAIGKLYSCEITIKTNEVIFVAIGATRVLYCKSAGPVKLSIPFMYLYDIVKYIKTFSTQISIDEGLMTIGNLTVTASTCFFQDDTILRSINLPINFSPDDILQLPQQYTTEELEFNNMNKLIRKTHGEIAKDVLKKSVLDKSFNQQLKLNLL